MLQTIKEYLIKSKLIFIKHYFYRSPLANPPNDYYIGFRGINLNDRFDEVQEMKPNSEQIKNFSNENNKVENNFINEKNKEVNEIENNKKLYDNQAINHKANKKFLFERINEDNSSSAQENINDNNIKDNSKNTEDNGIVVTMESSSLLSEIKNAYGSNLSKNEIVFNSLNTSLIMNISLPNSENTAQNQTLNQNVKINKKPLKNSETPINSTTNISSSERPLSRCTCKNSNCLKFYCECFANGRLCDNCSCINCKNILENKSLILEKYNFIISRNPKALQKITATKRSWTCKCKNSNCLKKYCDCFQNDRFCTSKCRCINCCNKNVGAKNNNNEKKIKRIRGIKKEKLNKIIKRNIKRNKILKNDEKSNNNENNKNEENIQEEKEKKLKNPFNFYTPKKQRNNYDKSNYIYYEKETTTASLTMRKERKRLAGSKTTDKKRRDVYTKLQMDNI